MRMISAVLLAASMAMLLGVMSPKAKADTWNEKTIVTFKEPVEIPGHVLLPGTYTFKLMNSDADRDIVEVQSKSDPQFVVILLANSAERTSSASKTMFEFEKLHRNSPEAIAEWFYPGDQYGQQFVYASPAAKEAPTSGTLGK